MPTWFEIAQKLGVSVADSSQQTDNGKTTTATAAALGVASATEGVPPCNLINAQSVLKDFGSEVIRYNNFLCLFSYILDRNNIGW